MENNYFILSMFRAMGVNIVSDAVYSIPDESEMKIKKDTFVRYLPKETNGNLTKVIVPEGIKVIAENAFLGKDQGHNDYMEGCKLPEGVTRIDTEAFSLCRGMTELHLPSTLKTIGDRAFMFSGLKSLELPKGLEEIGEQAFLNCRSLRELRIPSTVKKVGRDCFRNMGIPLLNMDAPGAKIIAPANIKEEYDSGFLDELFDRHEVEWY